MQVVAATPRPEVEELAKIIGKRLIDTNEDLWHELCALKEIVADFLTFEFGNMNLLNSTGTETTADKRKGNKSNRDKNSQYQSQNDCDSDSDLPSHNTTNDDFMNIVKDFLSVSKIHEVLAVVQEAFVSERSELEAEIALLQTTMDTESEVISRGNTPRRDNISEHFSCDNQSSGHVVSRLAEPGSPPVHKSVVILGPGRIRRTDSSTNNTNNSDKGRNKRINNLPTTTSCKGLSSKQDSSDLTHSLNLKLSELAVNITSTSGGNMHDQTASVHNGPSPSSSSSRNNSGSGSNRSRMRSRIESARDERFFMDEDIFMK